MTDRQEYGWQPPLADVPRRGEQDQPRYGDRYDPAAHRRRIGSRPSPYPPQQQVFGRQPAYHRPPYPPQPPHPPRPQIPRPPQQRVSRPAQDLRPPYATRRPKPPRSRHRYTMGIVLAGIAGLSVVIAIAVQGARIPSSYAPAAATSSPAAAASAAPATSATAATNRPEP